MKKKRKTTIGVPDYKAIKEISCYTDHTVTEADFNTNHPNPYRVSYTYSDIHRYSANNIRLNGGWRNYGKINRCGD